MKLKFCIVEITKYFRDPENIMELILKQLVEKDVLY